MGPNLREFLSWFDGSVVRDAAGLPALVHHQTWNDFEEFDRLAAVKQWGRDSEKINAVGCWFTDSPNLTKYGPKNVDVCLAIRVPLTYTDEPGYDNCAWSQFQRDIQRYGGASKFREYLASEGVDGIKLEKTFLDSETQTVWIALEPTQIRRLEQAEHRAIVRLIAHPTPPAARVEATWSAQERQALFALVEARERLAAFALGAGLRHSQSEEAQWLYQLSQAIERESGHPLDVVREEWRMWREAQPSLFARAEELATGERVLLYAPASDLRAGDRVDIVLRRDGVGEFEDSAVTVATDADGRPSVRALSARGNSSTYEYTALRPVACVSRASGVIEAIDGDVDPALVGLTKWDLVLVDQRPGYYYASATAGRHGGRYTPLVGPFATHVDALLKVPQARRAAQGHYGDARAFTLDMTFGTFRAADDVARPPRGVLNEALYSKPFDAEALLASLNGERVEAVSAPCPEGA